MPKISKASSTTKNDHGPVVDCGGELLNYAVNFVEFRAGH